MNLECRINDDILLDNVDLYYDEPNSLCVSTCPGREVEWGKFYISIML